MKDKNKNILDNLKISKSGFDIPENYLKHFENRFEEKSNMLKNGFISPENHLQSFEDKFFNEEKLLGNKNSGYMVPDNYFNGLEEKIYSKIKNPKVLTLLNNKYLKTIGFSIAASVLLFFSIYNFNSNNDRLYIENIEVTEMENWMDDDLISFNTYEISEIFNDNDLDLINNENDDILSYLDDNEIENLIFEN